MLPFVFNSSVSVTVFLKEKRKKYLLSFLLSVWSLSFFFYLHSSSTSVIGDREISPTPIPTPPNCSLSLPPSLSFSLLSLLLFFFCRSVISFFFSLPLFFPWSWCHGALLLFSLSFSVLLFPSSIFFFLFFFPLWAWCRYLATELPFSSLSSLTFSILFFSSFLFFSIPFFFCEWPPWSKKTLRDQRTTEKWGTKREREEHETRHCYEGKPAIRKVILRWRP